MLRRLVFGLLFCCACGVGFGFVIYVCTVAALCVFSIFLLFDFLGVVLAFFYGMALFLVSLLLVLLRILFLFCPISFFVPLVVVLYPLSLFASYFEDGSGLL